MQGTARQAINGKKPGDGLPSPRVAHYCSPFRSYPPSFAPSPTSSAWRHRTVELYHGAARILEPGAGQVAGRMGGVASLPLRVKWHPGLWDWHGFLQLWPRFRTGMVGEGSLQPNHINGLGAECDATAPRSPRSARAAPAARRAPGGQAHPPLGHQALASSSPAAG